MANVGILGESAKDSNTSSVKIFENPEFGKVRMVVIEDEPWFVGNDIASILEYQRPRDAVRTNVDEEDKRLIQMTDIQLSDDMPLGDNMKGLKITVINESGLYSLILRSEKPEAKKFKRWITIRGKLPSLDGRCLYSSFGFLFFYYLCLFVFF